MLGTQPCWYMGNEKADSAAKSALDLPRVMVGVCVCVCVCVCDLKHHITQYILSTWQDDWNGADANKFHSIKPVLGRLAVLLQAVQEG